MVNSLAPVLVSAVLGIAGAVLVESSLSFLGIGVQPPTPKLGEHTHIRKGQHGNGVVAFRFPGDCHSDHGARI